jgi:endoglucanase
MRTLIPEVIAFLVLSCWLHPAYTQETKSQPSTRTRGWWNEPFKPPPPKSVNLKRMPLISVRGSAFVDPRGDTVLFRGLAVSDPQKIESDGYWNKHLFARIRQMGASIVRIPIHPIAWRDMTPDKYLVLLDQAVEWCTELQVYVIIDWHSIGNLKTGLFQDPTYNTSMTETFEFWRAIAKHFSGHNTVAFYEIFNEPTLYFNQLGRMSWDEWKQINEEIIALIRAYDRETIPLVAGLDWAYDLTPLRNNPVEAEGIAYVTHPYPHKRSQPWIPKWEEDFGFAVERFPVLATEFGFTLGKEGLADNGEYGEAITSYLEGKGIGWVGWIVDPHWTPSIVKSWDTFALTECGEFFKKALQRKPGARQ